MILNLSTKSLLLLLATLATSSAVESESTTTTTNLRQNKSRQLSDDNEKKTSTVSKSYLRSPLVSSATSASASKERRLEEALDEPYIDLSSNLYLESSPITVTFSIGSPSHSYYSSSYAPSLNLNTNYPQWSIGLYMRDADPQGGMLAPIVSINVCSAFDNSEDDEAAQCDVNYESYNNLSVTFSTENKDIMEGVWPLETSAYGTGYDAYVLDANGAAAIGPYEFYITNDQDGDLSTVDIQHRTSSGMKKSKSSAQKSSVSSTTLDVKKKVTKSGLMKYNKGTKTSSRHHASVVVSTNKAIKVNNQMANSNGLEMSSNAIPESTSIHKTLSSPSSIVESKEEDDVAAAVGPSKDYITSNKEKYEHDESILINFAIVNNNSEENEVNKVVDLTKYKIGLYMRMAHPEGLDPIVSLPLCSSYSSTIDSDDSSSSEKSNCVIKSSDGSPDRVTVGSVTFSSETITDGSSSWPLDLYQWGTGYDAYIIDENGVGVVGPVKFDLMMDDTY